MLAYFGATVVALMMLFYALEGRHAIFTLFFAVACFAASAYGWLAGTWPFGIVELVWGCVALIKWRSRVPARQGRL